MSLPLITIIGTTGVGKSQLSIELAQNLKRLLTPKATSARVINADAMQVYRGMDIITNKIPVDERAGVEHLLMDFRNPGEQYVVGEWVADAINAIEETHKRNQVPIVVGGTSYWIQHLLFPNRLTNSTPTDNEITYSPSIIQATSTLSPSLLALFNSSSFASSSDFSDEEAYSLHSLLSALDPAMAARWHWRDSRKVTRSLRIIKDTGQRPSDIVEQQATEIIRPRYRTLCFWLWAEESVLNERLDFRVDDMVKRGLLDEVRELRNIAAHETDDYTMGIYQSIGYREFDIYLSNPTETAFAEATSRTKLSTRQYSKTQIRWIRNQLLPLVHASQSEDKSVSVYLLDATELGEKWNTNVRDTAVSLMKDFLSEATMPDPVGSPTAKNMLNIGAKLTDPLARLTARRRIICEVCTTDPQKPCMIEEGEEWSRHVKSRTHSLVATRDERVAAQKARQTEVRAARARLRGE